MPSTRHLVLWASLWPLAVGCGPSNVQPPSNKPPIVTVSHPIESEIVDSYFFEGYTAAVSTVDIRARVTGYLSKIYFQDGQDLEEGAPLFLIDPRPYQASLEQAQAELGQVQAQLRRLDADLARAEKLVVKRTISQEEYDRTAADRAEAVANVNARKAAIEQADLNLHFAAIKAPISGRVSRTQVTVGNLVAANETLLTTIVSVEPIYAYWDVDEPTVLKLQKMIREGNLESARETKAKVFLGLDIDEGYPHQGIIDFIENRVDPKTGTLKIRGLFPNKDRILSPGLHARIRLPVGKPYKALTITERAIGTSQGQKFVYVVNDKNRVVQRNVKLGSLHNRMRVIIEGLKPQERVIINGLQRVRDGVPVDPQPGEMTAQGSSRDAAKQLVGP
jgi:RND family efflux transporter MFP subunit